MKMRFVFVILSLFSLALAVNDTAAVVNQTTMHSPTPNNPYPAELSRDNGNIACAWVYTNGANTYAGDQYDTPSVERYLTGIKYNVWSQGWPDSQYQGYAAGCWKMTGGTPADVIWPTDGNPIYNPNTGGNWIFQPVDPKINLVVEAPNGFLVGAGFLYSYPANDGWVLTTRVPDPMTGQWQVEPGRQHPMAKVLPVP